jgi:hypothetical protein
MRGEGQAALGADLRLSPNSQHSSVAAWSSAGFFVWRLTHADRLQATGLTDLCRGMAGGLDGQDWVTSGVTWGT